MRTLPLGFVAASLLISTAALADVPKYGDLPKGSMTTPPDDAKKPTTIPAKEKVDGFNIGAPKFDKKIPVGARHVAVFGTASQAAAMTNGTFGGEEEGSICFTEAGRNRMGAGEDDDGAPVENDWETNQQSQIYIWLKNKENPQSGIMAVHSEKLVEKDGAASLETADAWVDPNTKGVRLAAKSSLPMKLVGTAMNGFRVFAARDDRTTGKKRVQFVFVRTVENQAPQVRAQGMLATVSDGMGSTSSGCRHLRVSLPVEEKGGESAVITATLQLPSVETEPKKPDAEPEEKTAKPVAAKPVRHRPPRMMGMSSAVPPSPMGEREIRIRELQANISVSKSTKDKEPLVSVSFGWSNRETTQRVFDGGE